MAITEFQTHLGRPENMTRAGKGRPKGALGHLTRERKEFIDMVVGEKGSEERKQFAASLRKQIMEGSANSNIVVYFLQMWLGKPKETVELIASSLRTEDLEDMTNEQLAARAEVIAMELKSGDQTYTQLSEQASEQVSEDVSP